MQNLVFNEYEDFKFYAWMMVIATDKFSATTHNYLRDSEMRTKDFLHSDNCGNSFVDEFFELSFLCIGDKRIVNAGEPFLL